MVRLRWVWQMLTQFVKQEIDPFKQYINCVSLPDVPEPRSKSCRHCLPSMNCAGCIVS